MTKKCYKDNTVLGLILARGGSTGIPKKNIKELAGKPLISYTIEAAKKSQYLSRSIVSTDAQDIAEVSRQFGADVPFTRPKELATDTASAIEVAKHALSWLKENKDEKYDYVMILQPTSPLRTARDIDSCIEKIVDTGADSVMSMYELVDFSLEKLKKIDGDKIFSLFGQEGKTSSRRQNINKIYKRNCAIYLTKTSYIMSGDLFGKVSRPYIMPPERSVDINDQRDFDFAEFLINRKSKKV